MTHPKKSMQNLWKQEYHTAGIPSSYKGEPSHAVSWFYEFLKKSNQRSGKILDLGCGKGRNSLYLAQQGFTIDCIDFLEENIASIQEMAQMEKLDIQGHCQSVTDPLPYPSGTFDAAIDNFCYKHQIDPNLRLAYRKELYRVLKNQGFFLLTLASYEDGFYGSLREDMAQTHAVVVDPHTSIPSILFSCTDVLREFSPLFTLIKANEKRSIGKMHGQVYERVVLEFIFKKA